MSDRCNRQKMMGRGAEGGCGTEQKPCPISRVRVRVLENNIRIQEDESSIDFYSQAAKVLCERSPYETEEAASRVCTLPVGLSAFLSKYSNGRRKHKKSTNLESGSKVSAAQTGVTNVWSETEEFFRPVTLADMEILFLKTQFGSVSDSDSCYSIPLIEKSVEEKAVVSTEFGVLSDTEACRNVVEFGVSELGKTTVVNDTEACTNVAEFGGSESGNTVGKELEKEEVEEREIDEVLPQKEGEKEKEKEKEKEENSGLLSPTLPLVSGGLHWLLGSKHKILLTSERPSKKRKFLGEDAGLERLLVVSPSQGGESATCHVCCSGDRGEQSNRFLVCESCNVAVHQRCYGVEQVPVGRWLCDWCNDNERIRTGSVGKLPENDGLGSSEKPCLLCPKEGGALKPMFRDAGRGESGSGTKFAHLFCCQWMPEVYVENVETMEPIVNIEEIKETRRRLVCNLCKVKHGVCIRCSHGTCRTAFHPICAREAKHRMEIWGKFGCDNVELRAFCSKHSASPDNSGTQHLEKLSSVAVVGDSSVSKLLPVASPGTRLPKLKLGRKTRDKDTVDDKTPDANCDKLVIVDKELPGVVERNNFGNDIPSDSPDLVQILKKLIAQGKVNVSDVASEMGFSSDSLATALAGGDVSSLPEFRSKIIKWLRNSAHMATSGQCLKLKSDCSKSSGAQAAGSDCVLIKSLPARRRMKTNIRVLKDKKTVCTSGETFAQQNGNGIVIKEINENPLVPNEDAQRDGPSNESKFMDQDLTEPHVLRENLAEASGDLEFHPSTLSHFPRNEGSADIANSNISEVERLGPGNGQPGEAGSATLDTCVKSNGEYPVLLLSGPFNLKIGESVSCSYVHPFISKRLMQTQNCMFLKHKSTSLESDGQEEKGMPSTCTNCVTDSGKQLLKARNMGILELSPEDEVEGEILYFQNRLLENAVTSKRHCEGLIFKVVANLPHELNALRKQRWDAVLVNQFLCEVREAKKQGRKERRHKEAQAVLAAATAAAAASSRISSSRKDVLDETVAAHHESPTKVNSVGGRAGPYSQMMPPRAKDTLSRSALAKVSSDQSEFFQLTSDFSKEHPRSCDICRRSETIINRVFVCCNCKVAVHLGCYRSVKDPIGPWYCELCEELLLQARSPGISPVSTRDRSCFAAQCGLCGGASGAFRKATDGQWVHAICAEWVLETTFRKGQPNPVEGMEANLKERDLLVCCICDRKVGLCIKCSYGHCQSTFHPTCAKNAGLYMNLKTIGGKFQRKAYCEKHSLEQREKAETQKHGAEELQSIKQIRVELERVRLLCERIIKREKLKRELVVCSHDILASKRDYAAFSVLVRSDVSSESVTTSLKGGHASFSGGAIQRSDDITVDSTISGERRPTLPVHMNIDRKTDDSSTSQRRKPTDRGSFSGKQLVHNRPTDFASQNPADDGEKRSKFKKHTQTFQKELIMTSDQASMQNQRLPKGFAYVPIGSLPKEKLAIHDTNEPLDPDG
ncbi:PHD finger family protein [Tasmannia lanceolata]|uniref:PHD finger family protein n=1 Tax=Tasmannia lanceolata TaxID=3420 RepID=UPI0040646220